VVGTHHLLLSRVVVGAHHPLLSRVVVVVGDGHSWAVVVCVLCCGAGWLSVVMGGRSSLLVDDSGGGPCPLSWGPGVMDVIIVVIQKVAVNVACSVQPYVCHVSGLVVAACVGHHRHCCSSLSLSLSLLSLLSLSLLVSILVAVVDVVVTV